MRVEPGHGVSLVFVVVVKAWAPVCGKGGNDVVGDAQNYKEKTLCQRGLRGWTQVPLAQAAWVQIPQVTIA
jgi:hypothetical protein